MKKENKVKAATVAGCAAELAGLRIVNMKTGRHYTCLSAKQAVEYVDGVEYRRATRAEVLKEARRIVRDAAIENGEMMIERLTATEAARWVAACKARTLTHKKTGDVGDMSGLTTGADKAERIRALLDSGEYRRPTPQEMRGELEELQSDERDALTCVEGLLGGLALMRTGSEHAESWAHDGLDGALSPHFDAIEKILNKARKAYAANLATMEKAIA